MQRIRIVFTRTGNRLARKCSNPLLSRAEPAVTSAENALGSALGITEIDLDRAAQDPDRGGAQPPERQPGRDRPVPQPEPGEVVRAQQSSLGTPPAREVGSLVRAGPLRREDAAA